MPVHIVLFKGSTSLVLGPQLPLLTYTLTQASKVCHSHRFVISIEALSAATSYSIHAFRCDHNTERRQALAAHRARDVPADSDVRVIYNHGPHCHRLCIGGAYNNIMIVNWSLMCTSYSAKNGRGFDEVRICGKNT